MATSYTDIIKSFNLARDIPLPTIAEETYLTKKVPHIANYGTDVNGNRYITYSFFGSGQDVEDAGYYGSTSAEENAFVSTGDYNHNLEDAIQSILTDSTAWSASFTNVAKITFAEPGELANPAFHDDIGILTFGQVEGSYTHFVDVPERSASTFSYLPQASQALDHISSQRHGDVWFNDDTLGHADGLPEYVGKDVFEAFGFWKGTNAYRIVYEEISHALGIDFINPNKSLRLPEAQATQQYELLSTLVYRSRVRRLSC